MGCCIPYLYIRAYVLESLVCAVNGERTRVAKGSIHQ